MSEQEKKVEVPQHEIVDPVTPPAPPAPPTAEEAKTVLTPKEVEAAQKHGLVGEKKAGEPPAPAAPAAPVAPEKKEEIKEQAEKTMTAEEEHQYTNGLTAKERGFYFKTKEEKQKRQKAEAERDLLQIKLNQLEKERTAAPAAPAGAETKDPELIAMESELAKLTNKGEDEFITGGELKRIRELEKQISQYQDTKRTKEQEEKNRQAQEFVARHNEKLAALEKQAAEKYPDWDAKSKLAQEVMKQDTTGVYAIKLHQLVLSDKAEDNAASIDYVMQIARLHPEYGKAVTVDPAKPGEKAPAVAGDETVRKVENNLQRKPSSAVLGTGSSRMVSEDDLTPNDVAIWSTDRWMKLKPETRRRLLNQK